MSLRDELTRLKARIAEIDEQRAKLAERDLRLQEERARLVTERQEIRAFFTARGEEALL